MGLKARVSVKAEPKVEFEATRYLCEVAPSVTIELKRWEHENGRKWQWVLSVRNTVVGSESEDTVEAAGLAALKYYTAEFVP